MLITRAFKTELKPNREQIELLLRCAGIARFTYNWGLERRIQEYKETGKSSNAITQHKQLNLLKKNEFSWMYEVSKCIPQNALRNLDKAYINFFNNVKNGKKAGFPKFKSKKSGINSFTLEGHIHIYSNYITLPRIGNIKLKESNYIPTQDIKILSATISEKAGHWFVSISCRINVSEPISATGEPIGIDLGVKTLAVLSDGREFENPKALYKALNKLRRVNRQLHRKIKGSNNRNKARIKLARLHYKISNIRKNILHQITSSIIKAKTKPSVVVLEDLNVSGMLKNRKLSRAISDVGFYEFRRQIEYKANWNGVKVLIAPRYYPSSKTCHVCGKINEQLMLSNRVWSCNNCENIFDRDLNAAINLRNLALNTVR